MYLIVRTWKALLGSLLLAMTILSLERARRASERPQAGSSPIAVSERRAGTLYFGYLAISVVWILGTDALMERLALAPWVGSAKDILYLAVCGLVLRRALCTYLDNLRREHRAEIESKREIVGRLAMAAEYRDDETGGHNHRIGRSAQVLAREMGLGEERCDRLFYAAALHDLGKIAVPDGILHKPGRLSAEERATMERHPSLGAQLLAHSENPLMRMAHDVALGHHERWDGAGYPNGTGGAAIPLEARIVAVCDVYDALTSERPYKRAWSEDEAVEEIRRGAGSHFDPAVVEAFLRCRDRISTSGIDAARPWDALRDAA